MPIDVTITKADSNFQFIAFLRINNPGMDSVTVAVIKASEVPKGTPLPVIASIIGITLTELAYSGIPRITANGTAHQSLLDKYVSTNSLGTKP